MPKARLRKTRRPLQMQSTVVAGASSIRPIVYGYRFPSRPEAMKIGYSSRGVERIREQTTGFPETPEVVFVLHHKGAADIESRIHTALAARQIHDTVGVEWFRVGLEDVIRASPEMRSALGRQRWRSPWRWGIAALGVPLGLVGAPMLAAALGLPGAAAVDVGGYVQALWQGNGLAWQLAWHEAVRVVWGPVGTETRLLAGLGPVVMALVAFGRR